MVLRVGGGHHHSVGGDEIVSVAVEVLVGHHVVAVPPFLQPVEKVGVGRIVAKAGAPLVHVAQERGAKVQDRPEARRVADPAPVPVEVVGREPVLAVIVRGQLARPPRPRPRAVLVVGEPPRVIPVHGVGERRHEHADRRPRARGAGSRTHEEGNHVLVLPAAKPRRIRAAREVARDREREVGIPAAVVEVVVVEVDGPVLPGGVAPAVLLAGPARALHRSGGEVDELAVPSVRPAIDHPLARDLGGEFPVGDDRGGGGRLARRRRARPPEPAPTM